MENDLNSPWVAAGADSFSPSGDDVMAFRRALTEYTITFREDRGPLPFALSEILSRNKAGKHMETITELGEWLDKSLDDLDKGLKHRAIHGNALMLERFIQKGKAFVALIEGLSDDTKQKIDASRNYGPQNCSAEIIFVSSDTSCRTPITFDVNHDWA